MSAPFLFMGEQSDPEMDNWVGRGMVRVYSDTVLARCGECGREAEIPAGEERWCLKCHRAGVESRMAALEGVTVDPKFNRYRGVPVSTVPHQEPVMPNATKPTTTTPEEAPEVDPPKHISTIELPGNGDAARLWNALRTKGGTK